MKLNKSLEEFSTKSSKEDSYWVERAKLDFAMGLESQRRAAKMTYAAIAGKIKTSAAYITKVFRGDSNMTIESMVKLARATGGHLDIRIVDVSSGSMAWNIAKLPARSGQAVATTATIVSIAEYAANHNKFSEYKAAA
jgi:transcriptional regulator with XRE-family HTH domain